MKSLSKFIIAIGALSSLVAFAATGATHTASMTKDQYIKHVEAKIADFDKTLSGTKVEGDKLDTGSDRYKTLAKSSDDIEAELKDAREDLRDLRASTSTNWSKHRQDIDSSLNEAQQALNRTVRAE